MKSPFWKTYAALAILAGLGAYVYFADPKKKTEAEKKKEKVFTLDKAKVKEIALAPAGAETVRLVKEGAAWKLAAPAAAPADSGQVDSLLSGLETLEIDAVAEQNPKSLASFGLEPPKVTVSAVVEGAAEPVALLIGDEVPAAGGTFAKLPAKPRVFIVPTWSAGSFNKKPFDLRDRDLLKVKRDAVKTLEITGPEGDYALFRDDRGEWAFTRPVATRAGRWTVDSLLGTLENLRMESVAAEEAKDLGKFGLGRPSRTVLIGLADGTSRKLEIGSSAGEKKFSAREAGSRLVAVIPGAIVDDLAKGMKEYRAKRVLEIATYDVEGFEVLEGATKRVYAKAKEKDKQGFETSKWKRTAPEAKDLETTKVEDGLFKLGGVEVQDFVDAPKAPAAYGLDAPVFKLLLRFGAGKAEQGLELGKKGEAYYAKRTGDASVLKLEAAKAEELLKAFREL